MSGHSRLRGAVAALASTGALGGAATATGAGTAPPARLAGAYSLAGRITVARHIPGERVGATVARTWSFAPACGASGGPCDAVLLSRPRPRETDRVLLTRVATGLYTGTGHFYAPLGCGGRIIRPGERVPFRITVAVAAVAVLDGTPTVARIAATYVSERRENLTRCVAVLGHDAARYHGYRLPGQP